MTDVSYEESNRESGGVLRGAEKIEGALLEMYKSFTLFRFLDLASLDES